MRRSSAAYGGNDASNKDLSLGKSVSSSSVYTTSKLVLTKSIFKLGFSLFYRRMVSLNWKLYVTLL